MALPLSAPPPALPEQLVLPLLPPAGPPTAVPPGECLVLPQRVWASLTPPMQARVYQILLRVVQEVVRDARHR